MPDHRIPLEPERVYHIYTHANGSQDLFRSDENYRYFLEKYATYIYPIAETFAYCLMPNHLHLMVRIKGRESLSSLQGFKTLEGMELSNTISRQFSHLFNGYTQAYNRMFNRKGSLFIPRFHRKLIDSNTYFSTLIAYIHNNPVNHGFDNSAADWPHSSWQTHTGSKPTKLAKTEDLSWFGGQQKFLEFHLGMSNRNHLSDVET